MCIYANQAGHIAAGCLLREIDSLVGPRGRSAFLVETARNEVRRQKLLQFLESKTGNSAWKDRKSYPRTRWRKGRGSAAAKLGSRRVARPASAPPARSPAAQCAGLPCSSLATTDRRPQTARAARRAYARIIRGPCYETISGHFAAGLAPRIRQLKCRVNCRRPRSRRSKARAIIRL